MRARASTRHLWPLRSTAHRGDGCQNPRWAKGRASAAADEPEVWVAAVAALRGNTVLSLLVRLEELASVAVGHERAVLAVVGAPLEDGGMRAGPEDEGMVAPWPEEIEAALRHWP